MKVLAFAASSSTKSINKQLVTYAISFLPDVESEVLDLNDYELPLFSEDREAELGQPSLAKEFLEKIAGSDALVVSFAEHNSCYSAAYKSLFDWCSRINPKPFQGKPMVLLATSPGPGGAAKVLEIATNSAPRFAGEVKATLSIPNFYDNFDLEAKRLRKPELQKTLAEAVRSLV